MVLGLLLKNTGKGRRRGRVWWSLESAGHDPLITFFLGGQPGRPRKMPGGQSGSFGGPNAVLSIRAILDSASLKSLQRFGQLQHAKSVDPFQTRLKSNNFVVLLEARNVLFDTKIEF
jgi:hypothetical protein